MKIKLFKKSTYDKILYLFGDVYILHIWIFCILIHPKRIFRHSILKHNKKDKK
jgi:hypothetical protein